MADAEGFSLWHRLTEPHAAVTGTTDRRRARLAAGLLLVLVPLAAVFVAVYARPAFVGQGVAEDALSIGVLGAFFPAYMLVRSPRFRWGILLLILAPLVAILASFTTTTDQGNLLYFSLVPILLGGLLLDFRVAAALATLNLSVAWLVAYGAPGVTPADLQSPFLFLLAASSIMLVGAGFLERSILDAEEANERLQAADAYRLRLLNTIVHDLSTPLTALGLHVAMLDPGSKGAIMMQRNIDLLQRLVRDVADLAKIESERLKLEPSPADLGVLARQAATALEQRAKQRGIALQIDAPSVLVQVDVDRITQVFYNLLSNAIKFTPEGGQIHVEVEGKQTHAEARVRDSGRGLSPDEIVRLFQPFSQVHDPRESAERGTGLGLFITKALVEAHGGRVWVKSDGHGKGSTFGFLLPVPG